MDIPQNEPTMNYGWLAPDNDDEEGPRVVTHEFGHALGCIHEHQNPPGLIWNKRVVYEYYMKPPNNWTKEEVIVTYLIDTIKILLIIIALIPPLL